ncbi:Cna B-type domain-containing protein [Enterococcus hermanniensis]|nr:Cna B-type domain-containing protein [Enterococcus hermanniensis]
MKKMNLVVGGLLTFLIVILFIFQIFQNDLPESTVLGSTTSETKAAYFLTSKKKNPELPHAVSNKAMNLSAEDNQTCKVIQSEWKDNDNENGIRPNNLMIELIGESNAAITPVVLKNEENWTIQGGDSDEWTFTDVKAYTPAGYRLNYEVIQQEQQAVLMLTLNYTGADPDTVKIEGRQIWQDGDNQDALRPQSMKIRLLANGTEVASERTGEQEGWHYSFTNLPKLDATGTEISYSLSGEELPDYNTTNAANMLVSTYIPKTTTFILEKKWEDGENRANARPANVQIQLYANDEKFGSPITLNDANQWQYTWENLALNQKGSEVNYTVKETTNVPYYTKTIEETDKNTVILTSTYDSTVKN